MNRVNLELLADWLILNSAFLVETNAFDMKYYRATEDDFGDMCPMTISLDDTGKLDCGTVGCAIGWAPISGVDELKIAPEDYNAYGIKSLSFEKYSIRVMGLNMDVEAEWDYIFSDRWSSADNSPRGAAIRILYLLANGLPYGFRGRIGDYGSDAVDKYMDWYNVQD